MSHYCPAVGDRVDDDSERDEYDGQGIYLCRVCDRCEREKLATFRPEILRPYTQADVDEPIEPES